MKPYKSTFQEAQKFEGLTSSQGRAINSKVDKAVELLGQAIDILDKANDRELSSEDRKARKTLLDVAGKLKRINV